MNQFSYIEKGPTTIPNPAVTSSAAATTTATDAATTTSAAVTTTPAQGNESSTGAASSTGTETGATGTSAGAAQPDGTQAAENNTESSAAAAPFELPGKQLSVLPIGLGVFAGISVIALIVVALVTYERTKYRKVSIQRMPTVSSH